MSAVVTIVGAGLLSDFVSGQLSADHQVVRQADFTEDIPRMTDLVLVLHDGWHPSVHLQAEEVLQSTGIPWLRGFVAFGECIVGPLVRPNTPGCSQCADMRRLMAGHDRQEMWGLQQKLADVKGIERDAWASRSGLLQAAYLIAAEARKVLNGSRSHTEEHVILINLSTLMISHHFFLPDPQCPICSNLPEDSPAASRISLQPSPKINKDSYRCRPLAELQNVLSQEYLDQRTGFLNAKMQDLRSPFADVSVNLPLFGGDEATAGRTLSYAESELTAILEGLERYCGLTPRGKRTIVHDSYCNLQNQALNPVRVGVHAAEQYARPDFPFKAFDPKQKIDWVWGYSFLQERPILVPELLAYYSLGRGNGFVYETSNGCAMGGSLEEAIFYGILEIVERDSFLLTWYAQLPLPRLDLRSVEDTELRLMIDRVKSVAGYDVILFNSTMDNGIPSVWSLAKNRKQEGLNLICAAGAHPDPVRAVKSSIYELAGMMLSLDNKVEANRQKYVRMLDDPFLVQQMEDHSMLYGLPQAEERLDFLLGTNGTMQSFDEAFKWDKRHSDITDDLKDLLQVFRRLNLDVIAVDQTTPELLRNKLYCVKVLIPGMLPITFGYHLTRLTGLDRVLTVPMALGYTKQALTPEQLNPYPHPFP